ncbi:MAG: hypothetical protein ACFFD4_13990 [Candidatus Odinarchaeota archaeon]
MSSISAEEFTKLQNPMIPEKFRLIYALLYYCFDDLEELVSITCDRVVESNGEGIILTRDHRRIKIPEFLFDRIKNYLNFNNKNWGTKDSLYKGTRKKSVNYLFESHRKGHNYTISTLYKKFNEHCQKVGIIRELTISSLFIANIGRSFTLLNQKLTEPLSLKIIITEKEEIASKIRYFVLHQNYEDIRKYEKDIQGDYYIDSYQMSKLDISVLTVLSSDFFLSENSRPEFVSESADGLYMYTVLLLKEHISSLVAFLEKTIQIGKKLNSVSLVIDAGAEIELKPVEQLLSKIMRPSVKYIPINNVTFSNITFQDTIVDFIESIDLFI